MQNKGLSSISQRQKGCTGHHSYHIPYNCGQVYISTTKRTIKTRLQEHKRHCQLYQIVKSAVAEHIYLNEEHSINFEETQILSNTHHYHARLYREAIEIFKHKIHLIRKKKARK